MRKSKIEWCDSTWNPVTGCLHGCEYCYARRIAERFGAGWTNPKASYYVVDEPMRGIRDWQKGARVEPCPHNFTPTLYRYRLDEPQHWKRPQTIFVCSMADLFGDWVPEEWIKSVIDACMMAPQHRYLFLTKNPKRYLKLARTGILPGYENFWYGSSATVPDAIVWGNDFHNTFVSIEPMLKDFRTDEDCVIRREVGWIIMGAMTGPGSNAHQPKKEWIEPMVEDAHALGIPVFMKDNLIPIVGEEGMKREFPWE